MHYANLHNHAYYVVCSNEQNISTTQSNIVDIITNCIIIEVYVNKTKKNFFNIEII